MNKKQIIAIVVQIIVFFLLFFAFAGIDHIFHDSRCAEEPIIIIHPYLNYLVMATISMIAPVIYLIKRFKGLK